MIDDEVFFRVREQFGHFASWAIWKEEGTNPKDNVGDLSVLNPEENNSLFDMLHGNYVILGLNISRGIERPLGNFHDGRPMSTDFKLRYAFKETALWGGYMTDVIKDFEEKASGKMMSYLRNNKSFELANVERLRQEIDFLGFTEPTLVALGKDAEKVLKRNLSDEFEIISIPHYANYISKENYRSQVYDLIPSVFNF